MKKNKDEQDAYMKMDDDILIMLEKAHRLKVRDCFEESVLTDRTLAVKKFGVSCAVITPAQLVVIENMAERYDALFGRKR